MMVKWFGWFVALSLGGVLIPLVTSPTNETSKTQPDRFDEGRADGIRWANESHRVKDFSSFDDGYKAGFNDATSNAKVREDKLIGLGVVQEKEFVKRLQLVRVEALKLCDLYEKRIKQVQSLNSERLKFELAVQKRQEARIKVLERSTQTRTR